MNYEHDELELLAEALNQLSEKTPRKSRKQKRIQDLADKVVKDQSREFGLLFVSDLEDLKLHDLVEEERKNEKSKL